jgi:hypothetical protein
MRSVATMSSIVTAYVAHLAATDQAETLERGFENRGDGAH